MRKKCIKFLTFFIISLLSCVLFSADTEAITLTTELKPTGTFWQEVPISCYVAGAWYNSQYWSCPNSSYPNTWDGDTYAVRTQNTYPVIEGNYYQLHLVLRNPNGNPDIGINPIFWNFNTSGDFTPVALEEYYVDEKANISSCTYSYSTSGNTTHITSTNCLEHDIFYNKIYVFTFISNISGNVRFQLGNTSSVLVSSNRSGLTGPYAYNYTFGLRKIVEFEPSGASAMNEKDDEDRSNIESQQESSSYDSGESASEATETGTTLLGAFSAFVSALTSATPSDCTLDMDLGNLDMGEVDFCELDPPAGFSALASVFLILFCVPLSIATARKIINLFRSFQ